MRCFEYSREVIVCGCRDASQRRNETKGSGGAARRASLSSAGNVVRHRIPRSRLVARARVSRPAH